MNETRGCVAWCSSRAHARHAKRGKKKGENEIYEIHDLVMILPCCGVHTWSSEQRFSTIHNIYNATQWLGIAGFSSRARRTCVECRSTKALGVSGDSTFGCHLFRLNIDSVYQRIVASLERNYTLHFIRFLVRPLLTGGCEAHCGMFGTPRGVRIWFWSSRISIPNVSEDWKHSHVMNYNIFSSHLTFSFSCWSAGIIQMATKNHEKNWNLRYWKKGSSPGLVASWNDRPLLRNCWPWWHKHGVLSNVWLVWMKKLAYFNQKHPCTHCFGSLFWFQRCFVSWKRVVWNPCAE